jgi:hypothetical protein
MFQGLSGPASKGGASLDASTNVDPPVPPVPTDPAPPPCPELDPALPVVAAAELEVPVAVPLAGVPPWFDSEQAIIAHATSAALKNVFMQAPPRRLGRVRRFGVSASGLTTWPICHVRFPLSRGQPVDSAEIDAIAGGPSPRARRATGGTISRTSWVMEDKRYSFSTIKRISGRPISVKRPTTRAASEMAFAQLCPGGRWQSTRPSRLLRRYPDGPVHSHSFNVELAAPSDGASMRMSHSLFVVLQLLFLLEQKEQGHLAFGKD